MSVNLKVGDMVADKTIVELGEYNAEADIQPVRFSDNTFGLYYGSNWIGHVSLVRSFDNELCNRLLNQCATMPSVSRGRERLWVTFKRRVGTSRRLRPVRLLFYFNEKKDFYGREDEVLEC